MGRLRDLQYIFAVTYETLCSREIAETGYKQIKMLEFFSNFSNFHDDSNLQDADRVEYTKCTFPSSQLKPYNGCDFLNNIMK